MLTLVVNPGVDQKCLEPAAGNGSILENAPVVGAVAPALGSDVPHCLQKGIRVFRGDMVFKGDQYGPTIVVNLGGHDRFRPMHRGRQIEEGTALKFPPVQQRLGRDDDLLELRVGRVERRLRALRGLRERNRRECTQKINEAAHGDRAMSKQRPKVSNEFSPD